MPHLLAFTFAALLALAPERPARLAPPPPLTPLEIETLLTSPTRRVRVLDRELGAILADGIRRSPTLGRIVAALEHTDVIVQIVASQNLPSGTPGRLMLVPNPKHVRFLRVQVRAEGTVNDLITLMGHELRHALEIGEAPEVRTEEQLIALYRRIGHGLPGERAYDTEAAHDAGRQILRELHVTAPESARNDR